MSERDERNVVDMRCYPVNEPEPARLSTNAWWWWLASGILLANLISVGPQLTQATQGIAGAVVILPAAMTLVRWWNARAGNTSA